MTRTVNCSIFVGVMNEQAQDDMWGTNSDVVAPELSALIYGRELMGFTECDSFLI